MIIVHTENEELIVQIMHEAFKEYVNPPSSAIIETERAVKKALANGQKAIVGLNNDGAVAMARYDIKEGILTFSRVSVLSSQRGKGYAKRLVAHLENIAKQQSVQWIACDVRANESRNIRLYESCGMHIESTFDTTNLLGHTMPVVYMKKQVQEKVESYAIL